MVRKPIKSRDTFAAYGIRHLGDSRRVEPRQSAKGCEVRVPVRLRELYGDAVGDQVFTHGLHWSTPACGAEIHDARQQQFFEGTAQQRDHRLLQVEPSLNEVQVNRWRRPELPSGTREIFEFEELKARQWHPS